MTGQGARLMRGLVDRKGEQFGYLVGNLLYTLEGEPTGRLEGDLIVDTEGNPTWRVMGDGVYTLDGSETIGYFTEEKPVEYQ
jgi:hypothetical protein